jgi:uncharacterized lipoprotein YajG
MQTSPRRWLLLGTLCLVVALLSGCPFTKSYISISYIPQTNVARIYGADAVTVRLDVKDIRPFKDRVSTKVVAKTPADGLVPIPEAKAIIAKGDVGSTVKAAIEAELANRGFGLGEGGVSVILELSKFYNDWKMRLFSASAVAEVTMHVEIKSTDGSLVFSKAILGEGVKDPVFLVGGSSAKEALESALRDAVSKLISDAEFIDALLKAGKS